MDSKYQYHRKILGQLDALEILTSNRLEPTHIAKYVVAHAKDILASAAGVTHKRRLALLRILHAKPIDPEYREACLILAMAELLRSRAAMSHDDDGWLDRWYRDAETLIIRMREYLDDMACGTDGAANQDSGAVQFQGAPS